MVENSLFRRIQLQLLMNLTARALGQRPERLWTRTNANALKAYAEYTSRHLQEGTDKGLLLRMNGEAYRMGRLLRHVFFISNNDTAQRLVVALYRNIGITLSFTDRQHLCFHRCHFSGYYTPTACLAASALDEGIIRGITGLTDGRLCFSQRITEGCNCCKATFQPKKQE